MVSAIRAPWQRLVEFSSEGRFLIGASVLRVLAGLTILYQYLINYEQRHFLFGPGGVWPYEAFRAQLGQMGAFSLYALSSSNLVFEVQEQLTFGHDLDDSGFTRDDDTWTRSGAGPTIELDIEGNAASLDLDPEGGCS